jgi:hypothetical protein
MRLGAHGLLLAVVMQTLTLLTLGGCNVFDVDQRQAQRQEIQRKMPPSMRVVRETPPTSDEWYALAFFRDPRFNKTTEVSSEFGLYLALSNDGYTWTPANDDRPLFVPKVGNSSGMRDPCVAQGPDGVYHVVWTWQTGDPRAIGYARSTDLVTWTDVRSLRVMPPDVDVDYCWAPEIVWAPGPRHWVVVWSVAIKGTNAATASQAEHNHRMFYATTTDFVNLSAYRPFLDPGYPSIDPAFLLLPPEWTSRGLASEEAESAQPRWSGPGAGPASNTDPGRWLIFYKDERQWPEKKQIRMVRGLTPTGPFGTPSEGLTINWVEAPSALIIDGHVVVYYDEYREGRYGAIRSKDLVTWDDVQSLMQFPRFARHGNVIRITPAEAQRLQRLRPPV